jgi:hypothetical protein
VVNSDDGKVQGFEPTNGSAMWVVEQRGDVRALDGGHVAVVHDNIDHEAEITFYR